MTIAKIFIKFLLCNMYVDMYLALIAVFSRFSFYLSEYSNYCEEN